ncbi:uncharacterized protein [Procambarus clarkii]|uniref:uncharacterized protein isoform X2 n=1 Tax=Procambarus clarkii TaxID=6728 RepID=UPI0037426B62
MEFHLLRLGTNKRYILNPQQDRGTNSTYVDDLHLQDVTRYAELRKGCKIGLGVPLSHVEDGIANNNYVFLQLCQSQPTEDSINVKQEQARALSSGDHAEPSGSDASFINKSSGLQTGSQKHGPVSHTIDHTIQQPGSSRQSIQGVPLSRANVGHPLASKYNFTSENPSNLGLQNTDTRPLPLVSLPQTTRSTSTVTHLPPCKPMRHLSMTQTQSRIQEPLSELHLQNNDHDSPQGLYVSNSLSSECKKGYPNQMAALPITYTTARSQSDIQSEDGIYEPQSEPRSAQGHQGMNKTHHEPREQIHHEQDNKNAFREVHKNSSPIFHQKDESTSSLCNPKAAVRSSFHTGSEFLVPNSKQIRIQTRLEQDSHQTKPSARIAPVQIQSSNNLLPISDLSHSSSNVLPLYQIPKDYRITPSLHNIPAASEDVLPRNQLPNDSRLHQTSQRLTDRVLSENIQEGNLPVESKVYSDKALALSIDNEDSNLGINIGSSDTKSGSLVEKSTPENRRNRQTHEPNVIVVDIDDIDDNDSSMSIDLTQSDTESLQTNRINNVDANISCDKDNELIKGLQTEEQINVADETRGNLAPVKKTDVLGKRKRNITEKSIEEMNKSVENPNKYLKKVHLSESSKLQSEREKSSNEQVMNTDSKANESKYSTVKPISLKETLRDWRYKSCSIAVERLPSALLNKASEGKVIISDENKSITLQSPVSEVNKTPSPDGINVPVKNSLLMLDDDDDDDLPDINMPLVSKKHTSHSPLLHSSESTESKMKINDHSRNAKVIKRRDSEGSFRTSKINAPGRRHERQSSHDSLQSTDAAADQALPQGRDIMDKVEPSSTSGEKSRLLDQACYNNISSAIRKTTDSVFNTSEASISRKKKCSKLDSSAERISTRKTSDTAFNISEASTAIKKNSNEYISPAERISTGQNCIDDASTSDVLINSGLPPNIKIKKEKIEELCLEKIKIKKEKVDNENSDIKVKIERDENSEHVLEKELEEDDVICIYSQVDETIWVSSDEEESTSQDISFGPMPSSPDLDIEDLFREDEEQKQNQVSTNLSKNDIPEEEVANDDLWFPVLSQSFFDDDIERKGSKSTSDMNFQESLPGPSGINTNKVNDNDDDDDDDDLSTSKWWPVLSQDFLHEINNDKVACASKDNQAPPDCSRNLNAIIEKLGNKNKRTAQLTDPKMPPPRTKSNNLRKRSRSQEYYGVKSHRDSSDYLFDRRSKDTRHERRNEEPVSKIKKSEEKFTRRRTMSTPPQRMKHRKSSHLRENLTTKFNLKPYKATMEHKPREKHHLVPKVKKEHQTAKDDDKRKAVNRKSHLVIDQPRAGENISIQKKNVQKECQPQEKPRTKVAAKVTRKTRSERLIDVDIFSSSIVPSHKNKKSSYKIPKNSEKDAIPKNSEKDATKITKSNVIAPEVGLVLTKSSKNMSSNILPPVKEPQNKVVLPDSDQENTTLLFQTDKENKIFNNNGEKPQGSTGILKLAFETHDTKKKKVHFPSNSEDLVSTLAISPRKDCNRIGIPEVRAREVLPKELVMWKNPIPPNFMDHFIYHICRWNYDWLEVYKLDQQKREISGKGCSRPPPVVTSTNYPTLILYNSFDDYKEIFSNLMYLEIWESIYQDWMKYKHSNIWLPTQVDGVREAFVETGRNPLKFWTLNMFTLIAQDQSNKGLHPRQGSLISLRIQEGVKKMHIFGHVEFFQKKRKRMISRELEQACPYGEVCLMMVVRVAKEVIQKVRSGKIILISNVSYIRPSTRTWEGLCKLPCSPLCQAILQPSKDVFKCEYEYGQYLVDGMSLNDVQVQAVREVSSKCVSSYHMPKMSLIHGPPGTGKTRTITALIAQIVKLSSVRKLKFCRILVCAPSNAAVDELTLRLIKLREIGIALRVVRVGVKGSINHEIKNCTLDSFVEKQIKMELSSPKNVSAKQEWDRRSATVKEAADKLQEARKANVNKAILTQMEIRLNQLVRSKCDFERSFRSQPTAQERYELQQKWQHQILINAQVITTTLGGCLSGAMSDVFGKIPDSFTCCIIDEAGQCKETETWLPLLFKIHKLVLVGDHRQLPATVLSQLAQDKNLKQSLFERLYHRFMIELQLKEMIHTLNIQYRMHPEIAAWPSQHFYMDMLTTHPNIADQRSCDLKPYIVFDLKTSQEQRDEKNELYNPAEASLIRLIIEVLEPQVGNQKIGVITPYQRQKFHLEERLGRYTGRLSLAINTVDAFQGQERDIVILSFVRANTAANIGFLSQRQRLNVALTRARKVCYIVASLSSLSKNKDWQSLIQNAESRGLVSVITEKEELDKNYIKSILQKQ